MYPATDMPAVDTPVVHYFAKEWIVQGYNVIVVHYPVNFPNIIYFLAKPFRDIIGTLTGGPIRVKPTFEASYHYEGVLVKRVPMLKLLPHSRYSKKQIMSAVTKTISFCEDRAFFPDVIISHFVNPQMEIMQLLKLHYNVPTCYVAHDNGVDLRGIYKNKADNFLSDIDVIGYRSNTIRYEFESFFPMAKSKHSFICYSGIPTGFLPSEKMHHDFSKIQRFIFVGSLIKRKYPSLLIRAISDAFKDDNFSLCYVGSGAEKSKIINEANKRGVSDKVRVLGRIERSRVAKELNESDVFVMISKNETFGLVYLEAMARGCITIASRNEGFDGIIIDGVNGYLCNAGDCEELTSLLLKIRNTSVKQLNTISENAMATAANMTDSIAARAYIDNVIKGINCNDNI